MKKTELTIRMLCILKARATVEPIKATELASLLQTNLRNIRVYKKELQEAGYDIEEKTGPYGGYILHDSSLFPVVHLNEKEKQALVEVRRFMDSHPEIVSVHDFRSATDKILSSEGRGIRHTVRYLQGTKLQTDPIIDQRIEQALTCMDLSLSMELTYQKFNDKQSSTFLIDPYDVIHYRNSYYLAAYSHARKDYRLYRFSLQRMKDLRITSRKFLPDRTYRLHQIVGSSGLLKEEEIPVLLSVSKEAADRFEEFEEWGLDLQKTGETPDSFLYSCISTDRYELFRNLFSFGNRVRIEEPASYREAFKKQLLDVYKGYGDLF